MPSIATSAGDLFYLRRGARGPALLCLHGAGGTHSHWGYLLRDLSPQAQVYTLDLPGHGRSAPPGRDTVAAYSDAVLGFAQALRLERVVLCGHSMGGAVALKAALAAPERVAGLALVGSGARLRVAPAFLSGLQADRPATIRAIIDASYPPGTPEALLRQAEAAYAACDSQVFRGDFLACDAFDVRAQLAQIACPAAIICGAEDRMTPPRYSDALHQQLPQSTLAIVPGAGHMLPIEQPAAVAKAIRSLIARLP